MDRPDGSPGRPEEMFQALAQGMIMGAMLADALEDSDDEDPDPSLLTLLLLSQLLQGSQQRSSATATPSSSSPPHQLLHACFRGDLEQVRRLADHPSVSIEGSPAFLHAAIKGGHLDIVNFLLERGVDKDSPLQGMCPLRLALAENNYPIFKRLVDSGADVSQLNAEIPNVLHFLASEGLLKFMELLINISGDGFNINVRARDKFELLHFAAQGHLDTAEFLVKNGADVNAKNGDEETPLHIACSAPFEGNSAIVDLLIRSGADVNAKDSGGFTPLHAACQHGNLSQVKSLLRGGAEIKPGPPSSLLNLAVMGEQPLNFIQFLVENGAEVWTYTDGNVPTTLNHVLMIYENEEVIDFLLSTSPPPIKSYLNDFLRFAISRGSVIILKAVIAGGVDVNEELRDLNQSSMLSPLHLAVDLSVGSKELVEILLEAGANADALDTLGKSPFDYAMDKKHLDVAECLLKHSIVRGEKSRKLDEALAVALFDRRFSLAKLLIQRGADPKAANEVFETATLLQACVVDSANDHLEIMQFLLDEGVDPDSKPKGGKGSQLTPLEMACDKSDFPKIRALVKAGANVNLKGEFSGGLTPFSLACQKGDLQVLNFLLDSGADIFEISLEDKISPLHIAGSRGKLEAMKFLLSKGLDINARTDLPDRQTPLHYAAGAAFQNRLKEMELLPEEFVKEKIKEISMKTGTLTNGSPSATRLLVEEGAELNAVDGNGLTALHFFCIYGDLPTVRFLIEKGAKVNDPSYFNETPLHLACKGGHVPLIRYLMTQGADLKVKNRRGDIPASTAALAGHWNTVIPLLGIDDPVILPFQSAAARGELNTQVLMESVDSLGVLGYSALHFAALNGQLDAVRYLLNLGANPTLKGNNEYVIHSAVRGKNPDVVKEVMESIWKLCEEKEDRFRVEMNRREVSAKETPLMTALRSGSEEVEELVEIVLGQEGPVASVVNLDLQNENGLTALHIAVEGHLSLVARILLLHKANGRLRDKNGRTPRDIAEKLSNVDIIKFLPEVPISEEQGDEPITYIDHNESSGGNEKSIPSVIALPPPPSSCLSLESPVTVREETRLEAVKGLSSSPDTPAVGMVGGQGENSSEEKKLKNKSFSCVALIFCCCTSEQ